MSWLNLNQSLNSLKGQITNFASEVLAEGSPQDSGDDLGRSGASVNDLEKKCRNYEAEITALKTHNDNLQSTLQSERASRQNGVKEDETNWYWDPPAQPPKDVDSQYDQEIRALQEEISALKQKCGDEKYVEEMARLKEENQNLTTNLEDLDNQHQQAMERLLSLKKELQKNFEVLKQEHEELKSTNDEYSLEVQKLLGNVKERDEEIKALKGQKVDYDTLHHKYLTLEKVHSLLKENAEKFQEENQELHEEVFKLQEQVTKLEHEIELSTKHTELSNSVPRETYEELQKELYDLKASRKIDLYQPDEVNIDDNAKSVIENLKREIGELKHKLTHKEDIDSANKFLTLEKITQLYNKYVNFEIPVDYIGEMPTGNDNSLLFKLESIFKTVNTFKKNIDTLEHKLSEKNHNINHMQTQIDDITSENDFLNTDIQHLESELNEMKKNNDFLISEIAALKNTSKLEPIIETHEDNLAKLETELADCNRINRTFESEIKRIEKELNEVHSEKKLLQNSLHDLRTKYTKMLHELEMCRSETKAADEMETTVNNEHSNSLKKVSDDIDELKKRLSSAQSKNEQLSIDVHIIENDKVLLTKQVDDLKHALEEKSSMHQELEKVKESLHQQLQDFERQLEEMKKSKTAGTDLTTELHKVTTEKAQIFEKFRQINLEKSSLHEAVEKLEDEIVNMRRIEVELKKENDLLKNTTNTEIEKENMLRNTIEELKSKIVQQEILNTEIQTLKEENHKIIERKMILEAELSATDRKIAHLEEDFEKLISDLNEKDTIIDSLNATIGKNDIRLTELNQNIIDLENSTEVKNQEIVRLTNSLEELTAKLNSTSVMSEKSIEELTKLHHDQEEVNKQIFALNDEVNARNIEISTLAARIAEKDKNCTELKMTIEAKDKEIKELNQSIVELSDRLKNTETTHHNDEYTKVVQDKENIERQFIELKKNMSIKEEELSGAQKKSNQIENTCIEYKTVLETAAKEKTELINLINLKHNESIQYHNEIQRLNQVLLEQANELKKVAEDKNTLLTNQTEACSYCDNLRVTLKEKDEIIISLNQNLTEYEQLKTELTNASVKVEALTEKCDSLEKNLTQSLENVKRLTAENIQLADQEQNSTRELERLRRHLVETEESYTQELMTSEQRLAEYQSRLRQVEERAKQTGSVYTSNSIRANQEVETLRNQVKLLEKQREEVQAKLSEAEDSRSRGEAALTNLQVVLEQFQMDKERDIHTATEKIRNRMESLKLNNAELLNEIAKLNSKLEESVAGLKAASRLGDQLETKTAQINDLKEQVRTLQTSVSAAEERYYNSISNQQDKIDKNLVKNLVINYVTTAGQNSSNKTQVLRILSTVLDFNQSECERLGLVKSANVPDSLAAEFVKFLQNESKPRAPMPNMMAMATNSRSNTPVSRKNSTMGPSPFQAPETSHKRNPSTGSNNLLFQNIDNIETASTVSIESDRQDRERQNIIQDTGVNQTRNNEGAILKYVLKDM